jgi:hypothetical protein
MRDKIERAWPSMTKLAGEKPANMGTPSLHNRPERNDASR